MDFIQSRQSNRKAWCDVGGAASHKVGWHEKLGACSLPLAELPGFTVSVGFAESFYQRYLSSLPSFPSNGFVESRYVSGEKKLCHEHADSCRMSSRCRIVR